MTVIVENETSVGNNVKILDRVCEKLKCTGCGACSTVCPVNCIEMTTDTEGFYYPKIDTTKCIGCNKCQKTCPSLTNMANQNDECITEAFAFIHNDVGVLAKSSSGGFFSAIAEWTFSKNGIVYGCEYDEHFNAVFRKAESIEEIVTMRGSKYVESKAWPAYLTIKQALNDNRTVLFIALPCQIAGLLSTLNDSERQNLITVDLLCHGVPSHKLFKSYLKELADKKGPIIEYHFRDKKYWGWGSWGTYLYRANGKYKEKKLLVDNDYYYGLYFKENNYRESCYRCQYASLPRLSDITIGDCWNIEEIESTVKSKEGVSLILVNSNKGKKIFDDIKNSHFSLPIRLDDAIKYNKTTISPAKRPDQRTDFYSDINKLGFRNAAVKYCKLRYVLPVVARYLPRNLKKGVKRIVRRSRSSAAR